MKASARKLRREIVAVVVLKFVLITILWWALVRDQRVEVDVGSMVAHAAGVPAGGVTQPDDGATDGH